MPVVKSVALKMISLGVRIGEAPVDRFLELSHLKTLLTLLKVNCVLDVGANRGQFAHELRGIGYRDRIISFEPIDREFAAMAQSFAGDPMWTGCQIALGAEESSVTINIPRLTVLSSILEPIAREPGTESQQIEMRRLDRLLPELIKDVSSPRVFLKMDTQGFDLEVFKGASGCIDDIVGMQSELSIVPLYSRMPHYLEALSAYEAAGFGLYNLTVVNRVSDGGLLELNCFMRRQ